MNRCAAAVIALSLLVVPAAFAGSLSSDAERLDGIFVDAAREFNVPVTLLRAIAYEESRWRQLVPDARQPGEDAMPASFGVMGLHDDDYFGHSLIDAAAMIGRTPEELKRSARLNVRGAAALLSLIGRGRTADSPLEEWEPAVAEFSGIPQRNIADIYTYDVFNAIRAGRAANEYAIDQHPVDLEKVYGTERLRVLSAPVVVVSGSRGRIESADYGPALWNPAASCNYTVGRTMAISHVTIHTTEGSYAGTISWFQNCSAQVSAHYVIRSSDGQITQMVYEKDKAWHVGTENGYTIGIEHEAYLNDPATWFTDAMYNASALLTRDICTSNGLDSTKVYDGSLGWNAVISDKSLYTVKGHVNFPNQTHTDPGSGWNWPKYRNLVTGSGSTTTQIFANPGFESGNVSWTVASSGDITTSTTYAPRTGSWYAWLGGWSSTHTDTMYQTVTIPSTATTATLTFYLRVTTAETTTTTAYDTLKVQVRNTSNSVLQQLVTLSNLSASCCYAQKSFDVSAYRGQTVRIYFEAYNDASLQTSFLVDDTALNVTQ